MNPIRSTLVALLALSSLGVLAAPPQMQAIVQTDDGLVLRVIETPKPAAGQVLIKVYAAGVNPVDWKRRPQVPGFDAAGVIDSVGGGVTAWKPGDAVIARAASAYAQYAVAPADAVVAKPASFTFEQAGGVPVAGVAGYRAVMEANVKPGQRVAIIGAAGGAGSVAVEVAKALSAQVIASGHSSQQAFLAGLGVTEFVAYDRDDVAAKIRDVDAVLNMVDGQAAPSLAYVKRGGHFASIAGSPGDDRCAAAGVSCVVIAPGYQGISDGDALKALVVLADKGQYTVTVSKTFPLAEAQVAQELNRTSDTTGKIILVVDDKAGER